MKKICPKYLVISNKSSNFAVDFPIRVIQAEKRAAEKKVS